jgi:Zn-dependent protease with chaperone function
LHLAIAVGNFAVPIALLVAALTLSAGQWQLVALVSLVTIWPPVAMAISAVVYRAGLSRWQVGDPLPLVESLRAIGERTHLSFARVMSLDPDYGQGRVCLVLGVPGSPTLAISASLASSLPPDQLVAVLAHEAAHVRHRHVARRMGWTAVLGAGTVAGAVALFMLVAPLFSRTLQPVASSVAIFPMLVARSLYEALVSRRHEAEADRFAVDVAGADALLGALEAIQRAGTAAPIMANRWTTHGTWEVRAARIRAMAHLDQGTRAGHARDRDHHPA